MTHAEAEELVAALIAKDRIPLVVVETEERPSLPTSAWVDGMFLELGWIVWWKLPFALIRSTLRGDRPYRVSDDELRRVRRVRRNSR